MTEMRLEQPGDGALRDELLQLWILDEVIQLSNLRAAEGRRKGAPGPVGSVAKISFAEINQRISSRCVQLLGMEGTLYASYDLRDWSSESFEERPHTNAFLRCQANSIEGGTSNILRNVVGERVLGLPPDPRVDKDQAWSRVPR
jgi:alkylation response protein AidB-like acyl-CoA dehydrogenase